MINEEISYDRLLKIKTTGRDDSYATQLRYPYEPTPYSVLERLANSGLIRKKNVLIDYGCGKARVPLFLSYQTRCRSIGVEYDEIIYSEAKKNLETAVYSMRTDVINQSAEEYPVPEEADRIFFFNPFSVQILKKVIENVRESYEKKEREILLFFYYPSKEYIAYLDGEAGLTREADIDCRDLLETEDERECVLVYRF